MTTDLAWGAGAAVAAMAAGVGAYRRRGWAPVAFAAAALAYLGRAASVGAQVWRQFPDRRALACLPVAAGAAFAAVALWLAWSAVRASARDT
ncbi:hypothetical protein [Roseisolibacter sp. H3M3-2]|uniref:hypothetical protein n=1 Tax=Roseisolibacter sp. H3M3-2 TaxID=3031323 RepID=UPI0023DA7549|nr:hypothetical protein [Roseisolibacter sp. H3M3-2]MDF1501782.1 hypothetical protein [Roseisolibacter sp. H3M3-2]